MKNICTYKLLLPKFSHITTRQRTFLQRYLNEKNSHNILAKEQLLVIFLSNWTSLNKEELIFTRKLLISPHLSNKHRHTPSRSSFLFKQHSVSFHPIPTLHWDFFFYFTGISYQVGKLNASETRQEWNCNSGCEAPQHCTLPRCTNVVFPQTFSGSGTVSKP